MQHIERWMVIAKLLRRPPMKGIAVVTIELSNAFYIFILPILMVVLSTSTLRLHSPAFASSEPSCLIAHLYLLLVALHRLPA